MLDTGIDATCMVIGLSFLNVPQLKRKAFVLVTSIRDGMPNANQHAGFLMSNHAPPSFPRRRSSSPRISYARFSEIG